MNPAYKKIVFGTAKKIDRLQLGEQEKLTLYVFSQQSAWYRKPRLVKDLFAADALPVQVKATEEVFA